MLPWFMSAMNNLANRSDYQFVHYENEDPKL